MVPDWRPRLGACGGPSAAPLRSAYWPLARVFAPRGPGEAPVFRSPGRLSPCRCPSPCRLGRNGAMASLPWRPHSGRAHQWGHGVTAVETRGRRRAPPPRRCRNGATASPPWRLETFWSQYPTRAGRPQWAHGVTAVETEPDPHAQPGPNRRNGATASPPWRPRSPLLPGQPKHRRRNGATASPPWRPGVAGEPDLDVLRRNGATASPPWRRARRDARP